MQNPLELTSRPFCTRAKPSCKRSRTDCFLRKTAMQMFGATLIMIQNSIACTGINNYK